MFSGGEVLNCDGFIGHFIAAEDEGVVGVQLVGFLHFFAHFSREEVFRLEASAADFVGDFDAFFFTEVIGANDSDKDFGLNR